MTAPSARRGRGGYNDADLRYARQALLALKEARDRSDEAASWAGDPRLRAIAVRARAMQDGDIRAITRLLEGWGRDGGTDPDDSQASGQSPHVDVSDIRMLDRGELDRRLVVVLTSRAEAAVLRARTEMVEGFEGASRRIAEAAIRANIRDLGALGRLVPAGRPVREPGAAR